MRKLFLFCLLLVAAIASAQDYFIVEGPQVNNSTEPGKTACFVFTSKASDLVITTNQKQDQQNPQGVKNAKGTYDYRLSVDISSVKERNITISKQGTVYRTTVVKKGLKAGKSYDYLISEVENYISIDRIGDLKDIYKEEGKETFSCIEFTTTLKNLKISFNEKSLPAKLYKKKSQSGADLYVLEIDARAMQKIVNDAKQKQEDYQTMFDALYTNQSMAMTEENISRCDELKTVADRCDSIKAEALSIVVSVPGSNVIEVPMDNSVVGAMCRLTGKVSFSVTPKTQKEYVDRFFSQYTELMHQAESHKASRNYDLAQQFYENAMQAKDVSLAEKTMAEQAAKKMGELAVFKNETDELADRLYQLSHGNQTVNKQALFELIDQIADRYETLYKETGDKDYLNEATRLRAEKQKVGFVFMGRFVMSEYKGGQLSEVPITNVRIYGSDRADCEEMDKPSYPFKGTLITTVTAADGRYKIRLKPNQYQTIIFEAVGNKDIKKNKHVSVAGRTDDRNLKIRFPKN